MALLPGEREAPPRVARPYGLVGLPISLIVILAAALVLCVVAGIAALAVAAIVLGWQPSLAALGALRTSVAADEAQLARVGVIISIVTYAAISIAVVAAARIRGGRRWRDLVAWYPWHPFRAAGRFWLFIALTIVYSFAADAIISHYYPPARDWVNLPKGPLWVGLFFVLAVVMAPLTEELLFRGWLYTALRANLAPRASSRSIMQTAASVFDDRADATVERPVANLRSIGVWVSLLMTAALFALAHWEKSHLYALAVFPVGVALGIVRERTGSLMASMTFHAVYNGAALATTVLGF